MLIVIYLYKIQNINYIDLTTEKIKIKYKLNDKTII